MELVPQGVSLRWNTQLVQAIITCRWLERNRMILSSKILKSLGHSLKMLIWGKAIISRIRYLKGQVHLMLRCRAIPLRIWGWIFKAQVLHQVSALLILQTIIMSTPPCSSRTTKTLPSKFHRAKLRSWCSKRVIKITKRIFSTKINNKWRRRLVLPT